MIIENTKIDGVYIINNFVSQDDRGLFIKTFNKEFFAKHDLQTNFEESYYSISMKNVIRGMHFQLPPHDHEKLVYVTNGEIIDVILDLRIKSPNFGQFITIPLTANKQTIYIPKGCAHGFLTISDEATVVYKVGTVYNKTSDTGIKWDSFGYEWENVNNPIISERDRNFISFDNFNSIFL